MPRHWTIFALFLPLLALAQSQQLQVIELRFRLADEVIPVVQPLVEPGGVLTGSGGVLFVRTSPANFAQIRQAIEAIDRRPRQLRVTVGQGTVTDVDSTEVRGRATLGSGDVQAGINAPPGAATGTSVTAARRTQRANLQNLSSVSTLEGQETFISLGQSVPVTTTEVTRGWGGTVTRETTGFRDASSGFYATVRVSGDTAILEISPRQQRLGRSAGGPVVQTAGATTTVSGPLGEWLPLGAVQASDASSSGGLLVWGRRTSASQYTAWVRVEEQP
jgi:type II secretory pathway component GspD/PulD (secretin)